MAFKTLVDGCSNVARRSGTTSQSCLAKEIERISRHLPCHFRHKVFSHFKHLLKVKMALLVKVAFSAKFVANAHLLPGIPEFLQVVFFKQCNVIKNVATSYICP